MRLPGLPTRGYCSREMPERDGSTQWLNHEGCDMRKSVAFAVLLILSSAAAPAAAPAQTFEKKNYNYSEWTKGRFSEAVTVIGPGKMIFLAGIGSENENGKPGDILHQGDFTAQCNYAFDKIKRALEKNGATLGDIVKMVTYMTDVRYQADFGKCRQETFGTTPMPAHTLLTINQLAWPGMLVEIDVTAVIPLNR
jgi:enamine deaminase RidA (YjgF/YER057c/UK114 family)